MTDQSVAYNFGEVYFDYDDDASPGLRELMHELSKQGIQISRNGIYLEDELLTFDDQGRKLRDFQYLADKTESRQNLAEG